MIINIDKPVGWTSFDIVKKVKRITGHKKVGHGGTLDPFASGVLILGTENDTKNLAEITNFNKSYKRLDPSTPLLISVSPDIIEASSTINTVFW